MGKAAGEVQPLFFMGFPFCDPEVPNTIAFPPGGKDESHIIT